MKPQWMLGLGTVSIFVAGIVGVITTDFASMLGAGVLFFAISFAVAVYISSRRKKGQEVDLMDTPQDEDTPTAEREDGVDMSVFERNPFQRDKIIDLYIGELNLPRDKAENLYDAGYTGWKDFSEAIPEDLVMVNGINPTIARRIITTVRSKMDF